MHAIAEDIASRFREPWKSIDHGAVTRISAGSFLESAIVVDALSDPVASRHLDAFLEAAEMVIEPVTVDQARVARAAYRDFGRGSGHPARLNFGDCFAYALAKATGEPLLFKGNGFSLRTSSRRWGDSVGSGCEAHSA